jgi:hypothetical protein
MGYKQERFNNAELLCGEMEKNDSALICDTIFFADKNKVNSIHLS